MTLKPKHEYTIIDRLIRFCLDNRLIVFIFLAGLVLYSFIVMPFNIEMGGITRDPVPVDAIPDIGENQQIVFAEWMGRSPKDVEDQVTYPLTIAMQGIPGIKTVRSYSYFGFSSIYVIFKEDIDFYWARSRVLEKLSSIKGSLPQGVNPTLGPDATALGQVLLYTLEGKGFSLQELRSVQDYFVKYALQGAEGVSEVASIGGYVKEYQIDINPEKLQIHHIGLGMVFNAIKMSNIDIGAKTIEFNKVEYLIRGIGFIKSLEDIENIVLKEKDQVPVRVKDVANVTLGPAVRRGVLDKMGAETVGGIVTIRYGENPMQVITNVKEKMREIETGLPEKTLPDGSISKVKIVTYYDRTELIDETLQTLNDALIDEIIVTIIVVLIMVLNLRASFLISMTLPIAVLLTFIAMKFFKVDSNIMSLSGIAIAIGTIVDMGIVVTENVLKKLSERDKETPVKEVVFNAASEVGGAIFTAVATTIVSFMPVFAMTGPEGKLFKPLAYTKTFALFASIIVALTVVPMMCTYIFNVTKKKKWLYLSSIVMLIFGIALAIRVSIIAGVIIGIYAVYRMFYQSIKTHHKTIASNILSITLLIAVFIYFAIRWSPLGIDKSFMTNLLFTIVFIGGILAGIQLFLKYYERILRLILRRRGLFVIFIICFVIFGGVIWVGFENVFSFFPKSVSGIGLDTPIRSSILWVKAKHTFPGMSKEFMPPLDEGSFLYMPTTMPHASVEESLSVLQTQNKAIKNIPEVDMVVGKIGRADTPLDPAPISMIETIITYKPKYRKNPDTGKMERVWRDHINTPDDIWNEITKAAKLAGTTLAPKLQPIAARIVMLQSGMRAPMGVKIKGPDLESIEEAALIIEKYLKEVPGVEPAAVFADRIVGKPYLEITIDREKIARHGLTIQEVQNVISIAVGGKMLGKTVEGRETYPIRIRYPRELRNSIEDLENILVKIKSGHHILLKQIADIEFVRGPMVIKSEDTFLIGYVLFDKKSDYGEVDTVLNAQKYLKQLEDEGKISFKSGVSYTFAGSYENQVRSEKKLMLIIPIAFVIIFLLLFLQFKSFVSTAIVFFGIFVAWVGGFIMLFVYSQDWFMNFSVAGVNMRELFNMRQYNLSVAVWVGFIALFGIASDNGVILGTYMTQVFQDKKPTGRREIFDLIVIASNRRIRPCLMTTATTILALIPVLTSKGRGSDVMIPMAIPSFGGMAFALITLFVVPVLYSYYKEAQMKIAFNKAVGRITLIDRLEDSLAFRISNLVKRFIIGIKVVYYGAIDRIAGLIQKNKR